MAPTSPIKPLEMASLSTLNEKAAAVTSCDGLNYKSTTIHLPKETGNVTYHDKALARKRT